MVGVSDGGVRSGKLFGKWMDRAAIPQDAKKLVDQPVCNLQAVEREEPFVPLIFLGQIRLLGDTEATVISQITRKLRVTVLAETIVLSAYDEVDV